VAISAIVCSAQIMTTAWGASPKRKLTHQPGETKYSNPMATGAHVIGPITIVESVKA
jgi:hypothetical protein